MPALSPGDRGGLDRVLRRRSPGYRPDPAIVGVPYGTDAGPLGTRGAVRGLRPGDIAQAHTKDEWVDLDQVR